ncbi:MAG: cbb3-type cytochrome oxidase assembly protein CcoS [Proteobacteria bacterium]|nr:cbb3-type cytochrome oxidase assembly protein CcoS [Pseudomonadota bacterium]MCL2307116.1 cbb3-type cytochrome oxidase assembly protein CcoS [Pseudomonadota bacterium]
MEILWLLIPMSVLLVLIMGSIFWWSVRSGQFDDLDGPAYRILADDDTPKPEMASGEVLEGERERKGMGG